MLERGDEPTVAFQYDSQETYASTLAAMHGELGCLKALIKSAPILLNVVDSNGNTPLHIAVQNGFDDIAEYLISEGAPVNAVCNAGMSSCMLAAQKGYWRIMVRLLVAGANWTALINYLLTKTTKKLLINFTLEQLTYSVNWIFILYWNKLF